MPSKIVRMNLWKLRQSTTIPHTCSAPIMETKGTEKISNRSKDNDIICSGYYGDGDSKAYEKAKDVYPRVSVVKYECVGHVQEGRKPIAGSGLTDSVIDIGIAIRSNVDNLEGMKNSVASVLFHVASTVLKPWHDHFSDSTNRCYRYKKDKALGTNKFVHGKGFSLDVIKHVKTILEDLQRDSSRKDFETK